MSNFWKSLDLALINKEIEHDLSWLKNCIISEILSNTDVPANPNTNPPIQHFPEGITTGETFHINSAKLYVLAVTLSINDNIKSLENIKPGFKRTINWNKYRSEITAQLKNNNLVCMIVLTFNNIKRLFVPSFKNGDNDPVINSFDEYYMPLPEIKDFNALLDNKPFLINL